MPERYELHRNAPQFAQLAQALLDAGLLKPSDWAGSLELSLLSGLARWSEEELGAPDLERIHVCLFFTDNVAQDDLNPGLWLDTGPSRCDEPVGALGLTCASSGEVEVGRRVRHFERRRNGLGFSLLGLVERALDTTVGGLTPEWAQQFITESWYDEIGDGDDDPGGEEADGVLARFHATMPVEACHARFDRALLEAALSRQRWPHADRTTLEAARALADLLDRTDAEWETLNDLPVMGIAHRFPVIVRWNGEDEMLRLWDDYAHRLVDEEWTEWPFLACFQFGLPATLHQAIAAFRRGVEIVVRTDRLLTMLHTPDRLNEGLAVRLQDTLPSPPAGEGLGGGLL